MTSVEDNTEVLNLVVSKDCGTINSNREIQKEVGLGSGEKMINFGTEP